MCTKILSLTIPVTEEGCQFRLFQFSQQLKPTHFLLCVDIGPAERQLKIRWNHGEDETTIGLFQISWQNVTFFYYGFKQVVLW